MAVLITIIVIAALLLASEWYWRIRRPHDELSRKFIHISVGSFVALWPWYLTKAEIIVLAAAFIVGVALSLYFNIFKAIHAVQRPTWGELCFAVAVGAIALYSQNPWIFCIAILHMAVADGLAAIVGTKYGKSNQYIVFGHTKSLAGSLTFLCVSIGLLTVYSLAATAISLPVLASIAVIATASENIAVRGLDNLLVPVFVAVALTAVAS